MADEHLGLPVLSFADAAAWEAWLAAEPRTSPGTWLKLAKKSSGLACVGKAAEVDAAKADGRWDAAYAPASSAQVPDDLAAALDTDPAARAFFDTLTGASRYAILYRIADAKKPETRAARIAKFVAICAAGEKVR